MICFTYRMVMIMSVRRSHCKMSKTCQLVTDTQTYSQPSNGWNLKNHIKASRHIISEHVAKNRNTLSGKLWMWASFPWKTLWNTLLRAVRFCAFLWHSFFKWRFWWRITSLSIRIFRCGFRHHEIQSFLFTLMYDKLGFDKEKYE